MKKTGTLFAAFTLLLFAGPAFAGGGSYGGYGGYGGFGGYGGYGGYGGFGGNGGYIGFYGPSGHNKYPTKQNNCNNVGVPEPPSMDLFAVGAIALGIASAKRKK